MSGIIAQNTLDSSGLIKAPEGGGAWNFIKKLTASGDADLSFVDGTDDVVLDSTYKEYVFTFKNIHPETDEAHLTFQANAAGGSGYNETMTTTHFRTYHNEAGDSSALQYHNDPAGLEQAQGTAFQPIATHIGADNDQNANGFLHLFSPSSTVFVKHYISEFALCNLNNYIQHNFTAGYFNTTSAIDEIQFAMSADNIDAGDICLYGISS